MSAQMIFVRSTSRIVPFNFDAVHGSSKVQLRVSYESATSTTPYRRSRVFECSPKISTVPRRTDAPTERSGATRWWTAWVRCPCRRGERPVSALGASRGRVSNDLKTLPVNVVPAAGRVYPRIGLSDRCGWRRPRGGAGCAWRIRSRGYSGNRARDAEARTGGAGSGCTRRDPHPGRCRWREDPSVAVRIYI